jgi:geranylgeranyl diphosphate synthase, type I
MSVDAVDFLQHVSEYAFEVDTYIMNHPFVSLLRPSEVREGFLGYLQQGGKRLRPFLVKTCCELVGGESFQALPAAAAVEVYHTWTLVHDDIIDRDDLRRGRPTLHRQFAEHAGKNNGVPGPLREHYGQSLSMLIGDMQHGFAIMLLSDLHYVLDEAVVVELIREMCGPLLLHLMAGEVRDVQLAFQVGARPSLKDLIEMMSGKTAALLEFCVTAGTTAGTGVFEPFNSPTRELREFALNCGIAFQIHDDILGLVGDEKILGKPIGSDLREGKYTPLMHFALERAPARLRERLLGALGDSGLTAEDVREVREIFQEVGALGEARRLAESYLGRARKALAQLEPSEPLEKLEQWAEFLLQRKF